MNCVPEMPQNGECVTNPSQALVTDSEGQKVRENKERNTLSLSLYKSITYPLARHESARTRTCVRGGPDFRDGFAQPKSPACLSQPIGRFDPASGDWLLTTPWIVPTRAGVLTLLPGYTSNGASVPRVLWPLVGPRYAADSFAAALAHDSLYDAQWTSRALADAVLRDLLEDLGVKPLKRWAYWAAVRIFGGPLWNAHAPHRIAQARTLVKLSVEPIRLPPGSPEGESSFYFEQTGEPAKADASVSIGTPRIYGDACAAGTAPSLHKVCFSSPNPNPTKEKRHEYVHVRH